MSRPESSADEAARLASLRALGVLDGPAEDRFDRFTRLACRMFDVPMAGVSLVDADRQWFKSRQGLEASETPREVSFCAHAIEQDEVLVVADASRDERFRENPLVRGESHVRFYAGCPLAAPDGSRIGTVCILDREPRELDADDAEILRDLGRLVEQEFASRAPASFDDLTGLLNRAGFEIMASQAIALCNRQEQAATLLYFDLDGFEEINATHGREVGDRALVEMAGLLKRCYRESDVIARLGGDEFCVLLTGAAGSNLKRPLVGFDRDLEAHNRDPERSHVLSTSVGVVSLDPQRHAGLTDLLQEAELHMHASKRSRRRDVE